MLQVGTLRPASDNFIPEGIIFACGCADIVQFNLS